MSVLGFHRTYTAGRLLLDVEDLIRYLAEKARLILPIFDQLPSLKKKDSLKQLLSHVLMASESCHGKKLLFGVQQYVRCFANIYVYFNKFIFPL